MRSSDEKPTADKRFRRLVIQAETEAAPSKKTLENA
jgi:hypothetical protein